MARSGLVAKNLALAATNPPLPHHGCPRPAAAIVLYPSSIRFLPSPVMNTPPPRSPFAVYTLSQPNLPRSRRDGVLEGEWGGGASTARRVKVEREGVAAVVGWLRQGGG